MKKEKDYTMKKETLSIIEKVIQNAKLVNKHTKKERFSRESIILAHADKDEKLFELLMNNDDNTNYSILEAKKDDSVHYVNLTISSKAITIEFKRFDWRGDADLPIKVSVWFDNMEDNTLEYIYSLVTKFAYKKSDEIYDSIEKEKRKKAVKKMLKKVVA